MRVASQNLSIMLTDIQGYSDATAAASRDELVRLLRNHNRLMIPVIRFHGGTIIKQIGDAFLVTFPSATDAAVCAIMIQLMLREFNRRQRDETRQLQLRVVINTGDVTLQDGDIFGDAVNVTARLEALPCFPGGSIGISESTFLLMNQNEIVAELIGPQQLKGIPNPVNVYRIPLDRQRLNELPTRLLDLVEFVVAHQHAEGPDFESGMRQILGGEAGEVPSGQGSPVPAPGSSGQPGSSGPASGSHGQPAAGVAGIPGAAVAPGVPAAPSAGKGPRGGPGPGSHPGGAAGHGSARVGTGSPVVTRTAGTAGAPGASGTTTPQAAAGGPAMPAPAAPGGMGETGEAPYGLRFKCLLIDGLVLALFLLSVVVRFKPAILLLLPPLYLALMWSFRGATVGQLACSVTVTGAAGSAPDFFTALLRTLVFPISFLPMIFGKERLLHDLLGNTRVLFTAPPAVPPTGSPALAEASLVRRAGSLVIDVLIFGLVFRGRLVIGAVVALVVLTAMWRWLGASPGQWLTGLRVVDAAGQRLGFGHALLRALLFTLVFPGWVLPLPPAGWRQTYELITNTRVIRRT